MAGKYLGFSIDLKVPKCSLDVEIPHGGIVVEQKICPYPPTKNPTLFLLQNVFSLYIRMINTSSGPKTNRPLINCVPKKHFVMQLKEAKKKGLINIAFSSSVTFKEVAMWVGF